MSDAKQSTSNHNLANWIGYHIATKFPELASAPIPGVWFTGSNVWSLAYGIPSPSAEAKNWDIFTIGEDAASEVAKRLDLATAPACRTKDKRLGRDRSICEANVPQLKNIPELDDEGEVTGSMAAYGEGYSYLTPRGEIDLWISTPGSVIDELRAYPQQSHAHCRMAFSFTDGLVMLPNELAAYGGAP